MNTLLIKQSVPILLIYFSLLSTTKAQTQLSTKELLKLPLDELMQVKVITASREEENLNNTPGVTSVITTEEIRRFGGNNLYEVLERITSVYMTGFHLFPQNNVSLRGDLGNHADTHVLILLNGRPLRESFAGGYIFSFYLAFPVSMIDRIEIVRGPGSVLYGSNAFMGVINVITKIQSPKKPNSVAFKQGTFNTQALEASGSVEQDHFKLTGGIKRSKTDGWLFSAINETGQRSEMPKQEDNLGAYVAGEFRHFKLNALFVNSTQDVWYIPLEHGHMTNENKRILLDLGYEHQFSPDWTMQANITYNGHDTLIDYIQAVPKNYVSQKSDDILLEGTHFVKWNQWRWLFGGTVSRLSAEQIGEKSDAGNTYSVYAQGQYEWSPSLNLIVGGQLVKPVATAWHSVPRFGLIYQFTDRLGVKVLHSDAFRTATHLERFINVPTLLGDPNLTPETITTIDCNVFYNTENYQLSATYFYSHEHDLIMKSPLPNSNASIYANIGELTFQGLELESKWKPTSHFLITSALTYQTNQDQTNQDDYTTVPNWMGKIGISYDFAQDSSISLFDNYFSQAGDTRVRFSKVKYVNPAPDAFHLITLNLRLNLQNYLRWPIVLEGYVYNALDEDIYAPEFARSRINSIPARQGRGAYVGVQYLF